MAVTARTLTVVGQARDALTARLDATSTALTAAWVAAFDDLSDLYTAAVTEVIADAAALAATTVPAANPHWPARARLLRYRRVLTALDATEAALETLSRDAATRATTDAAAAAAQAPTDSAATIAASLPPAAGTEATLTARYTRLDATALDRIVARSTQQITALHYPLSAEATQAVTRELIRGVTLGRNSRASAAQMVNRVEGRFNGGLTRALVIARTETADAYLAAAAANDTANADVLTGWTWVSKLDRRTCPSCFARHGTRHPLDEPGPLDHQQGRCSRVPITRTWRELGFDIDEPVSLLPDARAAFDALPDADQLAVMGPTRLAALRAGTVDFADLSTRRRTTGWRDSYVPTAVRDLPTRARATLH